MFKINLFLKNNLIYKLNNIKQLSTKVNQLKSLNFIDIKTLNSITNLNENTNNLKLRGWICSTTKSMKNLSFFHLNDGLSNESIQIVVTKELENSLKHNLTYGTSIICNGDLVKSKGKQQNLEFKCNKIEFSNDTDHFPFHTKDLSDDWDDIRQHLHLRFKTKHFASLQRIRSKLVNYLHQYLQDEKFLNITTPLITKNDCEGGGETFQLITKKGKNELFFGKSTYLTVSGQLHLEATVLGVNRVYTLSPCFRSESSVSRKHLSEFLMLELEETFIDSLDILMNRVEQLCKNIIKYLINECKEDIELILNKNDKNLSSIYNLIDDNYERITYEDALNLINNKSELPSLDYGSNFNTTCETFLTEYFHNKPIFITHFPSYIKPFYMKTNYDKAINFDLIYPISGEIAGGSLREDDYERMNKLFEIHNIKEDLEWYKQLRNEGSLPHGGFGLGIDRFVQSILGMSNIRDVVPFPRWIHHCKC